MLCVCCAAVALTCGISILYPDTILGFRKLRLQKYLKITKSAKLIRSSLQSSGSTETMDNLQSCEKNVTLVGDWLNTTGSGFSELDGDIEPLLDRTYHYRNVLPGGRWSPSDCRPAASVAIVITYRNREKHLGTVLRVLHTLLQRQRLKYGIFVVELALPTKFNIGILMNVGYLQAKRQDNYDCFIFHDVDLIPLNDKLMYTCRPSPNHMSAYNTKYVKFGKKNGIPYSSYVGGIISLSGPHYEKINGFSNLYFGWGGTDDDIEIRAKHRGIKFQREKMDVGRYFALPHGNDSGNDVNTRKGVLLKSTKARIDSDGINSVENVTHVDVVEQRELYTWILVSCDENTVVDALGRTIK